MKACTRYILPNDLKIVLVRSGNQCAFPGCSHPIVDDDSVIVAQLCHIEGVATGSQRHNPNTSDAETNSAENLIFLCYRHHKVTDNVSLYSVQKMREMKQAHEDQFRESSYGYSQKALENLIKEADNYWVKIEYLHSQHIVSDFKAPIDVSADILNLMAEVDSNLISLQEVSSQLMSKHSRESFEYVCLALPNLLIRSRVALVQIEIKYMEEQVLKNPRDQDLLIKLGTKRKEFEEMAKSAALGD